MKSFLLATIAVCAFALPPAAHADTLYDVTNGTLYSPNYSGTFSGTFSLDAFGNFTSASFTVAEDGYIFVDNVINNASVSSPGYPPDSINSYAFIIPSTPSGPPDYLGSSLQLNVLETAGALPILCTSTTLCNDGGPTTFIFSADPGLGKPTLAKTTATGGTGAVLGAGMVIPSPSLFALKS